MNIPTQHWTVSDVYNYISTLEIDGFKYNEFADMFRKEIINGRLLLNLEKDDLNVLGIHKFAKRNALYEHLQKLKASQPIKQSFTTSPIQISHSSHVRNNSTANTNQVDTNVFSKESTPQFTSFLSAPFSPQNIRYNNNNNHANLNNNTMTPLILPSPSPMPTISTSLNNNNNRIRVLQSNNNNNNNNKKYISPVNTNINHLIHTLNTNSPIYGASFPQIQSPLLRNTLTLPLPINNNNNNINNNTSMSEEEKELQVNTSIIRQNIQNEYHLLIIPGIYQGVNSHNTAFILMSQENTIELNDFYKQYGVLNDKDKAIKSRNIFSPLQQFECNIETQKIQHGWLLNKSMKLPFNPLIKFKLNIFTDEILSITPIIIKGHVNHINNYGQAWITSDLQIDAIEEITCIPSALISNIITLKLTNISHTSLQQRDASYMIHDPEHYNDYTWKKGLKLKFCLKLSTRTNKKNHNTQKPVFIQSWNVKPL